MRVKLRIETMRLAGAWFLEQLEAHPHLRQRFRGDTLAFMTSLATRTGEEIKIPRVFAERFVEGWHETFHRIDPRLSLQIRPYLGPATTGEEAIAEIVGDIGMALRKPRGRDPIDPIEAYEANDRHKKTRRRSAGGAGGCDYAHELAAAELGFKSKTAICEAITKGRVTKDRIHSMFMDASKVLPEGEKEILFVLTDAHEGGKSGVAMAVLVSPCKQEAD